MDPLAKQLDTKLRTWKPETAAAVRERVAEMIELADEGALDLMRAREREQEVLDILDESPPREEAQHQSTPKKSAYGLLAQYGPGPSAEEIDENRREMFR